MQVNNNTNNKNITSSQAKDTFTNSFNKSFSFYIKKIDFFSNEISFNFEESKRIYSKLGVVLTLIIVICSVTLCILFGQNIYERNNPTNSNSSNFIPQSTIYGDDLFFMMDVRNYFGIKIPNPLDYFYIVRLKQIIIGVESTFTTENLDFTYCNETHFERIKDKISPEDYEEYKSLYADNYLCVNTDKMKDYSFFNPTNTPGSSSENILFNKCIRNCPDDLDSIISSFYVDFKFINSYVDFNDYSNPVKYYITSVINTAGISLPKNCHLNFVNNNFKSDNGWIFEASKLIDFISLDEERTEVVTLSTRTNTIYQISLSSPQLFKQYNRAYMKIQDLFAKVGGFVNGLLIFFKIIFIDYFEFSHLMNLFTILKNSMNNGLNYSNGNINNESIIRNNMVSRNHLNIERDRNNIYHSNNNINMNKRGNNNAYSHDIEKENKDMIESGLIDIKKMKDMNNINNIKSSNMLINNNNNVNHNINNTITNTNTHNVNTNNNLNTLNNINNNKETNNKSIISNHNFSHYPIMKNNYLNKIALNKNKSNNNNINNSINNNNNIPITYSKDSEEINNNELEYLSNVSPSIFSYLKYRLSYVFCCYNQQNKVIINNIKKTIFDITSIQREIALKARA